jgi:5'-phosphate synthase pdxT subunit
MKIGVLALQGAFREHAEALAALGADVVLVRRPDHLAAVDGLVLPGGESTTQDKLLDTSGLRTPLTEAIGAGLACLATCAGLILLATDVLDGRPDQRPLGVLDVAVRRNGYGRQIDSFESSLDVVGVPGGGFPGIFIRAPRIERCGDVEVLAAHDGDPVLVRSGRVLGATFHPELSGDLRLHQTFLTSIQG